jgi:hypothetical protein
MVPQLSLGLEEAQRAIAAVFDQAKKDGRAVAVAHDRARHRPSRMSRTLRTARNQFQQQPNQMATKRASIQSYFYGARSQRLR